MLVIDNSIFLHLLLGMFRFEDGTISFLDVISLHHGFDALHRLTGMKVTFLFFENDSIIVIKINYIICDSLVPRKHDEHTASHIWPSSLYLCYIVLPVP